MNSSSTTLIKIAGSYGFKQVVCQPTHTSGGTIDLIFDNSNLILSSNVQILSDCNFSDHFPILCSTRNFDTNLKQPKIIHTRSLKSIDKEELALDLYDQVSHFDIKDSFPDSCQEFFTCTAKVLDEHAPLTCKTISVVPRAPWFDSEYKDQRKLRRKAEKKKHKSLQHKILFEELRAKTTEMANKKKQQYYSNMLEKNKDNVKAIYSIVNKELDRKQPLPLPVSDDIPRLCQDFNKFFNEKVKNIRHPSKLFHLYCTA